MKKRDYSSENISQRQPVKLNISELAPDQQCPELAKVQVLLRKLSYIIGDYEPARLDKPTQTALKKYQAFHSLEQTGTTDPYTVEVLDQPRCGTPDPTHHLRLEFNEFVLEDFAVNLRSGCDNVGVNSLTYTIGNTSGVLPEHPDFDHIRGAIDTAFKTWGKVIPVNFALAQGVANATFKFKWATGFHQDTQDFEDLPGGLLAHAYYPKNCADSFDGQSLSGQCHFDKAERWGLEEDSGTRTRDLETVALHEIGHLLGLTHSTDPNSIMFDLHVGKRRELKDSDVAFKAIKSIYGVP